MNGFENLANPTMIKPSSPTPHHKRRVNLSLLDQQFHSIHINLVIIYRLAEYSNPDYCAKRRVVLTTSLSEILTKFYPYAGRIKDNTSIECNDEGVVYTEAQFDFDVVSDLLSKRDPSMFDMFLPVVVNLDDAIETIPLLIQANFFKDGGLALGIRASHRIMDGAALSNFIRSWAITATAVADIDSGRDMVVEAPDFTIPSSLYPPSDLLNSISKRPFEIKPTKEIYVTKGFVFENSSIAKFKAKLGTDPQPTRVEAVTALIWKCAIKASRALIACSKSSSLVFQAVNTRKIWVPSVPENTPGNVVGFFSAQKLYNNITTNGNAQDNDNEQLRELVYLLKDELRVYCDNYQRKMQDNNYDSDYGNIGSRDAIDIYVFSSWVGFKLYSADFGWGKPDWIILPSTDKNLATLMDSNDGNGIEAWLTLTEQQMAVFQEDQDLLLVAKSECCCISDP